MLDNDLVPTYKLEKCGLDGRPIFFFCWSLLSFGVKEEEEREGKPERSERRDQREMVEG